MTAKPSLFPSVGRVLVYGVLLLAAAFFLLPLYAMLVTSFKDAEEIRTTSLLALPGGLNWSAWSTAWSSACTGVDCNGLRPFFWNSVTMAVPAVLISTLWGALNGYVLSLWKFRGSDVLFGLLLFGVFMPFQVVLLPMSQVLGMLGLSSSITGLVLVHCLAGLAGTTLFFRNYYAAIPKELVNAARMDGANFWQIFWRIVLPLSTPIFMVTLIWQFTNIWNDFLFGVFMPFQVVLLPMSQVLGMLGLSSSITGLVLVHCLAGLAGTTLFFRNYYAAIPKELVNAARMDGANFWQIFWRIVLPLSTPIFMVTLIWQFTNIWNDFLFGVVFSGTESKPITVGLNNLANTSSSVKAYNVDMAAAIIAGLPTMAIYVLAGKFFVRGLTAGAVKG